MASYSHSIVLGSSRVRSKSQGIPRSSGSGGPNGKSTELKTRIEPVSFPLMPELSRFFGIIIRMYMEAGVQHHTPHFHAYYQNEVAIYGIDPIELISGSLPKRQQRMVEAWAELHQPELLEDWRRLQAGQVPQSIAPLG